MTIGQPSLNRGFKNTAIRAAGTRKIIGLEKQKKGLLSWV